jgi:hypothetical protein
MASFISRNVSCEPVSSLSAEQLASLAGTYDRVSIPVWICDLWNRCVYRNPSAARMPPGTQAPLMFDIVDHESQVIGRLATSASSVCHL